MRLAAASPEPTTGTGTVYLRGFRPTYLAGCLRLNNIRVSTMHIIYDALTNTGFFLVAMKMFGKI